MNQDIIDVKPPVDVPGFPWGLLLLLTVIALAGFGLYRFWERRRKSAPIVYKAPWELALERLAELEARNLPAAGKMKEYFAALSDVIRCYIEDRFKVQAPEMTTEEFLTSVKTNPEIQDKHKDFLKEFLVLSDMVKFAKYGAQISEAKEGLDLAKRFVKETKVEEKPISA